MNKNSISGIDYPPNLDFHWNQNAFQRTCELIKVNPGTGAWQFAMFRIKKRLYQSYESNEWFPVFDDWITKHFGRGADNVLLDLGVIELDGSDFKIGHCRQGRIKPEIIEEIALAAWHDGGTSQVDMMTGEVCGNRRARNILYDENRKLTNPEITNEAIRIISQTETPWNLPACKAYVDSLEMAANAAEFASNEERKAKKIVFAQHSAIFFNMKENSRQLTNDIWLYTPHFKPCYTDRIFEIKSGLQSCSQDYRRAALSGVVHWNYDLKSSQLNILYQLTKYEPLRIFMETDKRKWAELLGISEKRFKAICYGLIFSAGKIHIVPVTGEQFHLTTKGELKRKLIAEPMSKELVKKTFQPVLEAIEILLTKLKNQSKAHKGRKYLVNECGSRLWVDSVPAREKKQTMLAFAIQGMESAIIHRFTVACHNSGILVYSNQHDGLITDQEIPQTIINQVGSEIPIPFCLLPKSLYQD